MTAIADNYGPVEITPSVSAADFIVEATWLQKKNGIVTIFITGKMLKTDVIVFATLPEGLRPWKYISGNGPLIYNDDGNVTSRGTVYGSGQIRISGQAGKHVSFTISYPAHH